MPKVSIIIPTYNRSHFILDAIDSVLNQTFQDFEIIVIDDGSTENTKEILSKYGSIIYAYQENRGRAEARNAGIRQAKGEYIAFLDDDDIWLPQKLEKQVAFLNSKPDIGLVHTFSEVIDGKGYFLAKETRIRHKLYKKAIRIGYTYEGMSELCIMFLSTVMLRKNCFDKVGSFDSNMPAFEDWDFYLRLALRYRIGTIPEVLVRYRLHAGCTTQNEFTEGRIKTSMKQLAILNSFDDVSLKDRARYNFYVHLANAYYIANEWKSCRNYTFKILRLKPLAFFSRIGFHFLLSFIRKKQPVYSERIIPQESSGGSLSVHLKRYEFAGDFCEGKIVLDAACGVGYGASYLSKVAKKVIGVDICGEAIDYAKRRFREANTHFEIMDIHNLRFPDKYFDIVLAFEALEHFSDIEKFISEAKRVLKEEGIFILSTPNFKKTNISPKNPYHRREFCKKDFESILKRHFVNVKILGQRRLQSIFHHYLQKIDVLHLRAFLPVFARRNICRVLSTSSWDDTDLKDFVISKEGIKSALDLIGVCRNK